MTQEEKELLLKDLSGRLPYGVMVECSIECGESSIDLILSTSHIDELVNNSLIVKPYLRPMPSMTEEEQEEFVKFHCVNICPLVLTDMLTLCNESKMFDWLNAHHFDYRGLILMGLALEAPEEIYKTI